MEKGERQKTFEVKLRNWLSALELEEVIDVKEEWRKFKSGILASAEEVLRIVNVRRKRKGSEWWDGSLSVLRIEKSGPWKVEVEMDQRELDGSIKREAGL